jgi:D-amino peptidase
VLLAFPGLLLAMLAVFALGVGLTNAMIAVGISGIPLFARVTRGEVLAAKQALYVEAARAIGARERAILWRHLLPNVITPNIVLTTLRVGTAIIFGASLSFLGLGAQAPTPEWGLMLSQGRGFLSLAWWISFAPGHDRARVWLTDEVNAAIAGAAQAGATEFVVADGHGTCRNILHDRLDTRARLCSGQLSSLPPSALQGLDASCDSIMLIGFHARAGRHPGVLDHTSWSQTVSEVRLNNRPAGEAEINAAYAGHLGIPILLVSGDDVLAAETSDSMPWVRAVAVKRALGRFQAESPPPSVACALIRQAAEEATRGAASAKAFVVAPPVTLELEFHHPMYVELAVLVPGCRQTGVRSATFTGDDYMAAFGAFTAMCGVTGIAYYQHR